ncbi:ion channel [Fusibacter bizertensis]
MNIIISTKERIMNFFSKNIFTATLLYIIFIVIYYYLSTFFNTDIYTIMLSFSFMYLFLFVLSAFEYIAKIAHKIVPFSVGIIYIFGIVLFMIIFFAINYLFLFLMDQDSFKGSIGNDIISQTISFIYFSVVTFTTVGFGDILPVSNLARIFVILESIVSMVVILLVFSMFSGFHETFKNNSPFSFGDEKKKK